MTREEFIEKAINKYGNKYDYSDVIYLNNKTKVIIKCNRCNNIFEIRPNDLLSGSGCKNCRKYHSKEYYIEIFKNIHGDKYDYSLMTRELYEKNDFIDIICPIHGTFQQKISYHLNKRGCPSCGLDKCRNIRKINIKEISKRLDDVCGNKLKYDLSNYKNTNTAFSLECLNCGKTFLRDVNALMTNNTCPYCNGKSRSLTYKNDEFIEKAKSIHGDKYDYSKTIYKNTDTKICVICHEKDVFGDEHGEFWVTPHAHIGSMKSGCPKCSGKYRKTTEYFIKEANLIHDNFYDYTKVEYINALTKVTIICPIHGDFLQTPNDHLQGKGCPVCKQSVFERKINKLLKEHNINFIKQYKPEWLKPKSLDFYLPYYNIAIEVQGIQHFKPMKYWGGEKTLESLIERDKEKRKLCIENNVNILYYSELKIDFPYEVINDKEKLLEKILENKK